MGDLALLRKAEVLEADRASFYKHSASKVLNPTGKAALLRLADAERRHLKIINSQRVSINNSGDADLSGLETPAFEDLKKDFDSSVKANQGDIDILEKAVKLERVDFPFYEGLYKQAKSPGVKKLFKVLEKEEKKHFGLISKSLRDLKKQGIAESVARSPRMGFFDLFKNR
jgi:rubrerythrin